MKKFYATHIKSGETGTYYENSFVESALWLHVRRVGMQVSAYSFVETEEDRAEFRVKCVNTGEINYFTFRDNK